MSAETPESRVASAPDQVDASGPVEPTMAGTDDPALSGRDYVPVPATDDDGTGRPDTVMRPERTATDDPDLRQESSELTDEDQPGNPADPHGLATDTLDGDDESETWEPDYRLSNATGLLITEEDPDNETIEQRLAQEVPDVGDIGAASTGPDHTAEADTLDANVNDAQIGPR